MSKNKTIYGTVQKLEVDVCQLCKYEGGCGAVILDYCTKNLAKDEYFIEDEYPDWQEDE